MKETTSDKFQHIKRDFVQKRDIFGFFTGGGELEPSRFVEKMGLKLVSDDFLTWGGAKVFRIYVFNICC